MKISEIKTDWQVTHSTGENWQIKLTNKIPDITLSETKLVKLINTSDVVITADSKLQVIGQSTIEELSYSNKKLNKLTFEHELSANLSTMETLGKHNLQLGSGVNVQISHTEEDVKVLMLEQQVKPLQKLINQFDSKVQLLSGTFSAEVAASLSSHT
jgi:uncharacterized protein YfkK (UPF0435 family)